MKKQNKERVLELIREGKNYLETNKELQEKENDSIAGSTYYRLKESIFPEDKMDKALEGAREKRVEREGRREKDKRKITWNSKKQKDADESKLAELINQAVYHGTFKFCRNKELKIEDVNEINLGGGIVASIMYMLPDVNLDHPLIVLATRGILFYLRFRTICSTVAEKVDGMKVRASEVLSGIKGEWQREAVK